MRWLAAIVLAIHLAWILWVVVGALFTRGRAGWTAFHLASLIWGIVVEVGTWPCPLTLLEQALEIRAGEAAWHGSFLVHFLDAIVYPHLPVGLIIACGVAVCVLNLLVYGLRFILWTRRRSTGTPR
jgi:hypothetical protein